MWKHKYVKHVDTWQKIYYFSNSSLIHVHLSLANACYACHDKKNFEYISWKWDRLPSYILGVIDSSSVTLLNNEKRGSTHKYTQNNNYNIKCMILLLLLHEPGIVFENTCMMRNMGKEDEKIT